MTLDETVASSYWYCERCSKSHHISEYCPNKTRVFTPPKQVQASLKSTGGPSSYYDMPFQDWVTTNDMMEYLAEHKWGKFGIHLKDIFKGLCRWGDKSGTDTLYDTKKIIYYGCRVLAMISGKEALRAYLLELLNDKQFGGPTE